MRLLRLFSWFTSLKLSSKIIVGILFVLIPVVAFASGKEYQATIELNRRNNNLLVQQNNTKEVVSITPSPTPSPDSHDAAYWAQVFLTPIPTSSPLTKFTTYSPRCKPFAGQTLFIPDKFLANDNPEDSISDASGCVKDGVAYSSIDYGCVVLLGYAKKPGGSQDPYSSVTVSIHAKTKKEMPCYDRSEEDSSKIFSNPIKYFKMYDGADQKDFIGIRKVGKVIIYVYKEQGSDSAANAFYGVIRNDVAYTISYRYFPKGIDGKIDNLEPISLTVDQLATQFFSNLK